MLRLIDMGSGVPLHDWQMILMRKGSGEEDYFVASMKQKKKKGIGDVLAS